MSSLDPVQYLKGLPLDYVTNFSRVGSYFAKDYRRMKPKKQKVSDDVLTCIESYSKKIGASSLTFENIEHLKENPPIITGQQPCLLTGPLFVMYKALTTVVLAERLNAVPVFWNASEDDDIAEVNHIWMVNSQLEKIELELEPKPFSKIVLKKEDIDDVISQIKTLTPPTEFREDVLDTVRKCSLTFSEMFSEVLSTLFSDYGLVVVEPHIFAELALPVYQKLIEYPVKAVTLVNGAGDSLERKGYKRQLYKAGNSCSFYIVFNDTRHNVTYDGKFYVETDVYAKKELLTLLDEHPECFSSTVVSRPLVQDSLFSTLGYCAGPGEVSYFAQMKEVYHFFGIEEPYIIPRFGATLVERKVQKVLTKYNIGVADLREPEKVTKVLLKKGMQEFFDEKKERILKTVEELEEYAASVDINLKKTGAAVKTHIANDLKALEEKTVISLKNQNRIVGEQIVKASVNVFPNRVLQERVLNVFQYIIRYRQLLNGLCKAFQQAQPGEHILVHPGD